MTEEFKRPLRKIIAEGFNSGDDYDGSQGGEQTDSDLPSVVVGTPGGPSVMKYDTTTDTWISVHDETDRISQTAINDYISSQEGSTVGVEVGVGAITPNAPWNPIRPHTYTLDWVDPGLVAPAAGKDRLGMIGKYGTSLKIKDQSKLCFGGELEDRTHLRIPSFKNPDDTPSTKADMKAREDQWRSKFLVTHGGIARDVWINAVYTAVDEIRNEGFLKFYQAEAQKLSDSSELHTKCMNDESGKNWLHASKAASFVGNLTKVGMALSTVVFPPIGAGLALTSAAGAMVSAGLAKGYRANGINNDMFEKLKLPESTVQKVVNSNMLKDVPMYMQHIVASELPACVQAPDTEVWTTPQSLKTGPGDAWEGLSAPKETSNKYYCKNLCVRGKTWNVDNGPSPKLQPGYSRIGESCKPCSTCPTGTVRVAGTFGACKASQDLKKCKHEPGGAWVDSVKDEASIYSWMNN